MVNHSHNTGSQNSPQRARRFAEGKFRRSPQPLRSPASSAVIPLPELILNRSKRSKRSKFELDLRLLLFDSSGKIGNLFGTISELGKDVLIDRPRNRFFPHD